MARTDMVNMATTLLFKIFPATEIMFFTCIYLARRMKLKMAKVATSVILKQVLEKKSVHQVIF